MKYDDASWHYGGDFPEDLPDSAGATHIGFFVAWALLNDLGGDFHTIESPDELTKLVERTETPAAWFMGCCDEKFVTEDLNDLGNAFAGSYYVSADGELDQYVADYGSLFDGYETLYHVPDTWESFDWLSPVLDQRLEEFQTPESPEARKPKESFFSRLNPFSR